VLRTAGVDEVGRGSLFGPVVAAAVVLAPASERRLAALGLTDSKALSPLRRRRLLPCIHDEAQDWAIGMAAAAEIDRHGIRAATEAAMRRALAALHSPPDLVLVDGNLPLRGWSGPQRSLVAGDRHHMAIAAASVIAKQHRDGLVRDLALLHPGYGLERHVGYATARHRAAILERGPCPEHRRSFLTRLLQGSRWQPAPGDGRTGGPPADAGC
jgi:ribonuclease HII